MDIHRNGSHDLGDQPGACERHLFFSYIFWYSCIYIWWWYMMIYDDIWLLYFSCSPIFLWFSWGYDVCISCCLTSPLHRPKEMSESYGESPQEGRRQQLLGCPIPVSPVPHWHTGGRENQWSIMMIRVWQRMASLSWSMIDDGSWNWSLWISQSMIIHVDIHNGVNGDIHLYQHLWYSQNEWYHLYQHYCNGDIHNDQSWWWMLIKGDACQWWWRVMNGSTLQSSNMADWKIPDVNGHLSYFILSYPTYGKTIEQNEEFPSMPCLIATGHASKFGLLGM